MIDSTLLKRFAFFLIIFLNSSLLLYSQSNIHRTENWIPGANVDKLEYSNGYTMLSGGSTYQEIGPYSGSCTVTDLTTGTAFDPTFPKVHGVVYESYPDGTGGWYISGYFDAIDTVKVSYLAHIKADKTVDRTWKPNPDNTATGFLISGNTLYVSGYFNTIAGQTRNHLAAFDMTTGNLTSWNPNANDAVLTLGISGTTIYAGGYFTSIGGQARTGLAALNQTTGSALTTFAPNIVGTGIAVRSIAVDATTMYIGGSFTVVNGLPRINLARVNLSNGALVTTWTTNTNGYVNRIGLSGTALFVAGGFTTVNGITRNGLASVNAISGGLLAWNIALDPGDWVDDFSVANGIIYFIGYFDNIGVNPRVNIAAADASTAVVQAWDPNPNGGVNTIYASATGVFYGGDITGVNWLNRNAGFILLNDATDEVWPFTFDLNGGVVNTIAVNGNTLYVGGQFSAINKSVRRNLAAFNLTTGELLPWAPLVYGTSTTDPDAAVYTMKIKDNLLYIGGKFYMINSPTPTNERSGLAAIDLTTALLNAWNPQVGDGKTTSQYVNSIDISGNTVYVGGFFSLMALSQARTNLAAVDATSGAILPWAPASSGYIDKIRVTSSVAYVVGEFRNGIAGVSRPHRIAALNLNSNLATSWNPELRNGDAYDIALGGTELYVSGSFDSVALAPRPGVASFTMSTGNITQWNPDIGGAGESGYFNIITTSPSKLYVAGNFYYLGMENRSLLAEYDICPPIPIITANGTTLTTTSTGTLQWYENGVLVQGATSPSYEINPLEYGVYAVTVTANGCTVRSSDAEYLITADETRNGELLKIYPNPVRGDLFVDLPTHGSSVDFTVMDIMGRTIRSTQRTGEQHQISVNDLKAGPYLLIIKTNNQKLVKKIVKID